MRAQSTVPQHGWADDQAGGPMDHSSHSPRAPHATASSHTSVVGVCPELSRSPFLKPQRDQFALFLGQFSAAPRIVCWVLVWALEVGARRGTEGAWDFCVWQQQPTRSAHLHHWILSSSTVEQSNREACFGSAEELWPFLTQGLVVQPLKSERWHRPVKRCSHLWGKKQCLV